MDNDKSLRQHLLYLLTEGGAHAGFEASVKDVPVALRGQRPPGIPHSPWELLEHLRIAQRDILEFTRNPKHVSPDWPAGYWPKSPEPPTEQAWEKSAAAFRTDLAAIVDLVKDPKTDLFAPLAHGDGQTALREILLVADHNAYHLGQMVLVRRLLGAWD